MNDDDMPGRYSMIGQYGEDLWVVLARLLACSDCGAVVADTDLHDRWHDTITPRP